MSKMHVSSGKIPWAIYPGFHPIFGMSAKNTLYTHTRRIAHKAFLLSPVLPVLYFSGLVIAYHRSMLETHEVRMETGTVNK